MLYKGIGLPDRFYTKLRYTQNIAMSSTLGGLAVQQMRGNSLFDCDLTGTGAQPQYFDQICASSALYTQYLVYGSKISVRFSAVGDTYALGNWDVVLVPSQTVYASTGWGNFDDISASKNSKSKALAHYGQSLKSISHYATTSKMFDVKNIRDNLSTFSGTPSTNPTASWVWIIAGQPMDRTSTSSLNIQVKVTYYVQFFNLTDKALS